MYLLVYLCEKSILTTTSFILSARSSLRAARYAIAAWLIVYFVTCYTLLCYSVVSCCMSISISLMLSGFSGEIFDSNCIQI